MLVLLLLIGWSAYASSQDDSAADFTLLYKWNVIDYEWPTAESRSQLVAESKFVPQNCYIRDLKVWNRTAYVTLPRWKAGVPATLACFSLDAKTSPSSPPLQPYPSWSVQTLDDCSSLQNAHTIDVDADGRLWVLDAGLVEELGTNRTACSPKLMVIDLQTREIIKRETIPVAVLVNGSLLTSMALDSRGKRLFIADSNSFGSGFIVYDATAGTFQRFGCEQLNPDEGATNVNYVPSLVLPEFVSIALNTNRDRLYFSTADSSDLLYVNVSVLATDQEDISDQVVDLGSNGRSSKLVADSMGYMYFNLINQKSVAQWRESSRIHQYTPRVIVKSKLLCHWISSLDVDEEGSLWIVSSRFHDYSNGRFRIEKDNIRIFRTSVPRPEKPRRSWGGFSTEYVVLILFIVIIGLIIIEILMFNSD